MFDWITRIISQLRYLGIGILAAAEHVFPPIPSELVIPLAGFVAAKGELRLGAVIAVASAGSLLGATFWYGVGRKVGEERLRRWADRSGRWIAVSGRDFDHAGRWFRRHGRAAVLIGRLAPGVRTFVSLPAGFSRMPLGTFLFYTAIGTVIWTTALAFAGVVLRANFTVVADYMDVATTIVFTAAAALIVRRYIRCWRTS